MNISELLRRKKEPRNSELARRILDDAGYTFNEMDRLVPDGKPKDAVKKEKLVMRDGQYVNPDPRLAAVDSLGYTTEEGAFQFHRQYRGLTEEQIGAEVKRRTEILEKYYKEN